jgi:hypothetical protein
MTLMLELAGNKEALLKARAQARGVSAEEYASQVLDRDLEEDGIKIPAWAQPLNPVSNADARPIWEVIAGNMKDVPPEDMAALPKDGASQIDHYVYGLPKRDQ